MRGRFSEAREHVARARAILTEFGLTYFLAHSRDVAALEETLAGNPAGAETELRARDRKSTRLNSSHVASSYAVFCLKKKNDHTRDVDDPGHRIVTNQGQGRLDPHAGHVTHPPIAVARSHHQQDVEHG